jgi:hypothetical protein
LKTFAVTAVVRKAVVKKTAVKKKMSWAQTIEQQLKDAPALLGLQTDCLQARRDERALSILVSPPSLPVYRFARKIQGRLYPSRGLSLTNRDLERLAPQFAR